MFFCVVYYDNDLVAMSGIEMQVLKMKSPLLGNVSRGGDDCVVSRNPVLAHHPVAGVGQ